MSTEYGFIKWFSMPKGYGFIIPEKGGEDVFLHAETCKKSGVAVLMRGQRVEFERVPRSDGSGRLEARIVNVGGSASELVGRLLTRCAQLASGSSADDVADAWLMREAAEVIVTRTPEASSASSA